MQCRLLLWVSSRNHQSSDSRTDSSWKIFMTLDLVPLDIISKVQTLISDQDEEIPDHIYDPMENFYRREMLES